MKKHIIFLSLITLFVLACTTIASAYPKATDHAKRWQFDFDAGDLAFYRDEENGDGYWVMRYEVTNNTGNDRQWTPNMELVTDKGEIIVDGKDVPRDVQLRLLDVYGDELLKSQSNATGKFLQGKENAIRGLVIWRAGDERAKEIQVFVAGVSGDTADVIHPLTGEKHKLHRVIQLSWKVDGPLDGLQLTPLPTRPVSGGTSTRRLTTDDRDAINGDEVVQKWIFR